ncbi:MAG: cytochrome c class [Chitinophagaceae bacterium]|nr:cytochrome c class [Chitinophagaceae bacterium]
MNYKIPTAVLQASCIAILFAVALTGCKSGTKPEEGWKAPPEADRLFNPLQNLLLAEEKGKELYNVYCWSCHGTNGYGDGAAGNALGQKPANFHDERIKKQRQGALFWKITNGKGNMPPFKDALTEEQRWQLVTYVRKFSEKPEGPVKSPKALRPGIEITHVMNVEPLAVRILQNTATGDLYYTTFDGDIYRIKNLTGKEPASVKILSAKDHGISRLQGAIFNKNSLFLCGNVDTNNKKVTSGRMVRFELQDSVPAQMSVVFNTVQYGANKTIYDHGWNAVAISPDGKYIFVNSGARTDHGEIQDNGGLFPNARDNALTGKIFRIPIDAKNLLLTDDLSKLKADSLLYAQGIRNAYDMAFDAGGNLFAVVNSSDYDSPEDMFWVRQGHHYGFPWIMGGIENPQQYPGWQPNPDTDPFINKFSHSWQVKYYYNDSTFPKRPAGVKFSAGVQNIGPDANEYRGHSGKIQDGDSTGVTVSTFTAHSSPLGLFFDVKNVLAGDFKGDGFVIRYSLGSKEAMMGSLTKEGSDLLDLHLTYDQAMDNYIVKTTRIVDDFTEPTDAVMIGNEVYIIEYGGRGGHIWKISLPKEKGQKNKSGTLKKK